MSMTDPIADFLTRIRNATKAGHSSVKIPRSKIKSELAKVLKNEASLRAGLMTTRASAPSRSSCATTRKSAASFAVSSVSRSHPAAFTWPRIRSLEFATDSVWPFSQLQKVFSPTAKPERLALVERSSATSGRGRARCLELETNPSLFRRALR